MKELSARDKFIVEKYKKGFGIAGIVVLLKQEDFTPVTRQRVYQILERAGVLKK